MILWHLYRASILDLLRVKRLLLGGILVLLPMALAILWRTVSPLQFDPVDTYNTIITSVVYGFVLVIVCVVLGTGIIGQEMEQKTIVYLLTKPVARWKILLSKALAAVSVAILTSWCAAGLLALAVSDGSQGLSSYQLKLTDVRDPSSFLLKVRDGKSSISEAIRSRIRWGLKLRLDHFTAGEEPEDGMLLQVIGEVNRSIKQPWSIYNPRDFEGIELSDETRSALRDKSSRGTARSNRFVLDDFFSMEINRYQPSSFNIGRDLAVLPFGACAYLALFLLLGTLLNRPLLYGLLFAFGWEQLAPNMPGNFQLVSVMSYLRTLSPHPRPPAESVDLIQWLTGTAVSEIKTSTAWIVLAFIIAGCTSTSLWLFSTREFVPREDAE